MSLPVEQDRYDRAIERAAMWSGQEPSRVQEIVAAFSAELERQGVRLVPLAEIEAFIDDLPDSGDLRLASHLIEIRTLLHEHFGGEQ